MSATKTVWPVACPEGSRDFIESQTLDDHEEELYEIMHQHFLKHLEPFATQASAS